MIRPDASALELVLEAQRDPIIVLRICQSRLIEARDLATINFDEMAASLIVTEVSVILAECARALKAHALSPPFQRPSRATVKAAVTALDTDTAADDSAAWAAL